MSALIVPGGPTIPAEAFRVETMRASGPGGQHVNTTESAVRVRMDLSYLHPAVVRRIAEAEPGRVTDAGELLVESSKHRSQHRNLEDARQRISDLIVAHLRPPKRRKKTRPTRASQKRRMDSKTKRGQKKQLRQKPKLD